MVRAEKPKAKPKPKPKFTDKAQSERFIKAARTRETIDKAEFDRAVTIISSYRPVIKPPK